MSWFGKKPADPKAELKDMRSEMRSGQHDLAREVRRLDTAEAKCKDGIRKYASEGNKSGVNLMAKELVNIRKQRERLQASSAVMSAVQTKAAVAASVSTMATAMGSAAAVLQATNARIAAADMPGTMRSFALASDHMAMTDEALDDMMADCFDEDEAEADDIVSAALSEMNLKIGSAMPAVPVGPVGAAGPGRVAAPRAAAPVALPAGGDEDPELAAILREVLRK